MSEPSRRKNVQLIYLNAGGGHRAAALALQSLIVAQQRPWDVELVDLSQVLQPGGHFKRLTGINPEDLYNKRLARGWTWGMRHELRLLQVAIRLVHPTLSRLMQAHWARTKPDLVVSLIPNFNLAMRESLHATLPGVPFVTVMTDLADCAPHFWAEPGDNQHLVCGTPYAREQALMLGVKPEQITLSSGMVLRTEFYQPPIHSRTPWRRACGLSPSMPTGLVMFGGWGSNEMLLISKALHDVQLVFICGHNAALAKRLRRQRQIMGLPHAVVDHTSHVAQFMDTCDFMIGKPGPGSLSEALQRGLPVVTWVNGSTMPQERYNAQWVREQGVGVVVSSPTQVREGVSQLLDDLPQFVRTVGQMDNRAVYEVVEVMARQIDTAQHVEPEAARGMAYEVWREFEAAAV